MRSLSAHGRFSFNHNITQALRAQKLFIKDKDYIIKDNNKKQSWKIQLRNLKEISMGPRGKSTEIAIYMCWQHIEP